VKETKETTMERHCGIHEPTDEEVNAFLDLLEELDGLCSKWPWEVRPSGKRVRAKLRECSDMRAYGGEEKEEKDGDWLAREMKAGMERLRKQGVGCCASPDVDAKDDGLTDAERTAAYRAETMKPKESEHHCIVHKDYDEVAGYNLPNGTCTDGEYDRDNKPDPRTKQVDPAFARPMKTTDDDRFDMRCPDRPVFTGSNNRGGNYIVPDSKPTGGVLGSDDPLHGITPGRMMVGSGSLHDWSLVSVEPMKPFLDEYAENRRIDVDIIQPIKHAEMLASEVFRTQAEHELARAAEKYTRKWHEKACEEWKEHLPTYMKTLQSKEGERYFREHSKPPTLQEAQSKLASMAQRGRLAVWAPIPSHWPEA
jgi:hypothetical protein